MANMPKTAYWIIGIALLLLIGGTLYWQTYKDRVQAVSNFEECAAANYPVMESDPRRCATPDGRIFAEEKKQPGETATTTDNGIDAKKDLIQVNVQANQVVKSPFAIKGEARGTWYFEASFPVKLLDANGNILVQAPAQAQGEWMTTDFVPFEITLTFAKPATATGVLVLEKDNPSGLPQFADELRIPVKFQ